MLHIEPPTGQAAVADARAAAQHELGAGRGLGRRDRAPRGRRAGARRLRPGAPDERPRPGDAGAARARAARGHRAHARVRGARRARAGRAPPGRNDPCWCGSGKKYKKCHLDGDAGRK
ncbi:MAG: SEC-C metal-binding domain-containing protein [Myxococcota bacterium]